MISEYSTLKKETFSLLFKIFNIHHIKNEKNSVSKSSSGTLDQSEKTFYFYILIGPEMGGGGEWPDCDSR